MAEIAAAVLAAAEEQDKQYASILVEKPLGKISKRIIMF